MDFNVDLDTFEVSVLGFASIGSNFVNKVALEQLPESVYANVVRNVIYKSYNVYQNRNNGMYKIVHEQFYRQYILLPDNIILSVILFPDTNWFA